MQKNWLDETRKWMGVLIENGNELYTKPLINESQESKSIDAAKKLYMQRTGSTRENADNFVRNQLRQDLPTLRSKEGGKFILGVTRMFLDGQLQNASDINKLNTTLKYIASDAHINEYDRNLNGMSAQDLIQRFQKNVETDLENSKNELNQQNFTQNNDYDIVRIDSFDQAEEYSRYVSWCVVHDDYMFDSYTSEGINQFYFCLKKGFENVPMQAGENCPLDEYGLSMIAVCVDGNGALSTCTCRWNHDNGGDDNIMNVKEISQVIGQNFYTVFKPNTKMQDFIENAKEMMWDGYRLDAIFDWYGGTFNGIAVVSFFNKYTYIKGSVESQKYEFAVLDKEGKPVLYEYAAQFHDGLAAVSLNGSDYTYIDKNFNYVFKGNDGKPVFFQYCCDFKNGYAEVNVNSDRTMINTKGEYFYLLPNGEPFTYINKYDISFKGQFCQLETRLGSAFFDTFTHKFKFKHPDGRPIFFKELSSFKFDIAIITNDEGKQTYVNKNLDFICKENDGSVKWFDHCDTFTGRLVARVKLYSQYTYVNNRGSYVFINAQNKKPLWFNWADYEFNYGFASVNYLDNEYYITLDGKWYTNSETQIEPPVPTEVNLSVNV